MQYSEKNLFTFANIEYDIKRKWVNASNTRLKQFLAVSQEYRYNMTLLNKEILEQSIGSQWQTLQDLRELIKWLVYYVYWWSHYSWQSVSCMLTDFHRVTDKCKTLMLKLNPSITSEWNGKYAPCMAMGTAMIIARENSIRADSVIPATSLIDVCAIINYISTVQHPAFQDRPFKSFLDVRFLCTSTE